MPYTLAEQVSRDLDIFLFDGTKIIHLASAGGFLPEKIANAEFNFDTALSLVNGYRRVFPIIRNPELKRSNLINSELYFESFDRMSRRGFYSYDKVYIDDLQDQTYQLIAHPIYDRFINVPNFNFTIQPIQSIKYTLSVDINLLRTEKELPIGFAEFNLLEHI